MADGGTIYYRFGSQRMTMLLGATMAKRETAEYIASMVGELASMARENNLPLIAHLCRMTAAVSTEEAKRHPARSARVVERRQKAA